RLSPGIHRGIRASRDAGDRARRARRALSYSRSAADDDQGRHHQAWYDARSRLLDHPQLLRSRPARSVWPLRQLRPSCRRLCRSRPVRSRAPTCRAKALRRRQAMTERLYYTEPARRSFDAVVTAVVEHEGAPAVVLDRTAFYPTSGGQPYDIGRLGTADVVNTIDDGDQVLHVVKSPFSVGEAVRGEIDWVRRSDHMQQHT